MKYKCIEKGRWRCNFNKTDFVIIDKLGPGEWCVELWVYGVSNDPSKDEDGVKGLRLFAWPENLPTLALAKERGNFMRDIYEIGHQHGWHNGHEWGQRIPK